MNVDMAVLKSMETRCQSGSVHTKQCIQHNTNNFVRISKVLQTFSEMLRDVVIALKKSQKLGIRITVCTC